MSSKARGRSGSPAGFSLVELLFTMVIAGTLTAIAVPQGLRALDDVRTRGAARYLAQRLGDARLDAIKRDISEGLRFEPGIPDYRVSTILDGNGNGLRTADLQNGIDRALTPAELLNSHFSGVAFGILDGIPDADGQPSDGSDGVRVGVSKMLSMNPDGTSSSGTLYVHGSGRSQYAVRIFGVTGRVRVLRYDQVAGRWLDQ